MAEFEFHGYAIISDDDCIADASCVLPESLMNEADWIYFQAELDLADLCLLGRASHELTPNKKGRRRLVISSTANGLEERADAIWWNPADLAFEAM